MKKNLFVNTIYEWDSGRYYQYVTRNPAQVFFNFYPNDEDTGQVICTSADYIDEREKTAAKYDLALGAVTVGILDRGGRPKSVEFGSDNSSPMSIDITCEEAEERVELGQMRFWRQGSTPPAWQ